MFNERLGLDVADTTTSMTFLTVSHLMVLTAGIFVGVTCEGRFLLRSSVELFNWE